MRTHIALLPRLIRPCVLFCVLVSLMSSSYKPATDELPEENRFTKVVLAEGLNEPMAMTFLKDGRVLIVERKGGVRSFNTKTNILATITTLAVNTKYTSKEGVVSEAEEGLIGIVAHPNFEQNHWIYMYYADATETRHVLARWELHGDSLYANTKKILLAVPTQREICCHTGGGMVFDKEGNLYLSVGNNTANPPSGTASYDERPGRSSWDDQRGSGNTNDLRGKILRIHPENDGSYTIPDGNLFPKGTDKTKPEIYVMGDRNPWRVALDSKTGYLYWGEVGPDASVDSIYGSRGYDEFNQARKAGYFGWPYFVGDNRPYAKYDYEKGAYGDRFDPEHPVNNSPNNTGLKDLPIPQKAFIWYPYATSPEFPLVGSSGRSATGGPIYHRSDFSDAKRPWPAYFEGKWLTTDFVRGWIMAISMDAQGNYKAMENILPHQSFNSAIDMQFGPEGDLYVLEYGSAWFTGNANSALVRVEYNAGNRKPVVEVAADKLAGAIPFKTTLSSKGTTDYDPYDQGALKYNWTIQRLESTPATGGMQTFTTPNPTVTLTKPGTYNATLTVSDTKGTKNSKTLVLKAGNEPPVVSINILKGNKTFFFPNESLDYSITITDKEDGSVAKSGATPGRIKPQAVAVNFDYVPEGFDPIEIAQNHRSSDKQVEFSAGLALISNSDCRACHTIDKLSVGPSFIAVAQKYKRDGSGQPSDAEAKLATKIIKGGGGVWGEHAMSAHPSITQKEAETIVSYILSLDQKTATAKSLPLKGTFVTSIPAGQNGQGGYLLRAKYTDKGAANAASLSTEELVPLRNPLLDPEKADTKKNTKLLTSPLHMMSMLGDGSFLAYNNIDLNGIKQVEFLAQVTPNSGAVGGNIEIRLDSPEGKLIGQTGLIASKMVNMVKAREDSEAKAKKAMENQHNEPPKAGTGTSAGFNPNRLKQLVSTSARAMLEPVSGQHTVYFVFKNSQASPTQVIMHVFDIKFQNVAGDSGE